MTYREARESTVCVRCGSITLKAAAKYSHNYLEYNPPSGWCQWTIAGLVCISVTMKYDVTKSLKEKKLEICVKNIHSWGLKCENKSVANTRT